MKKFVFLSALFSSLLIPQISAADTLAQWTFESLTLSATAGITPPVNNFAPEVGSGEASALHAGSATVWSTPAGNGSTKAFSANTWAVGDYFQFKVSSVGYSGISIGFDQTGSNTGPKDFNLLYSADGISFTSFGSYSLINGGWSAGTPVITTSYSFNLSAITALDNTASIYFRLVDASTTAINSVNPVATGGTDRVDNFTVSATPVPEPSSAALLGGFGLLGFFMIARRRK